MDAMRSSSSSKQVAYELAIETDYRHNMLVFVLLEFLWGMGVGFAAYFTMVPGFLSALDAPRSVIGLIQAFPVILTPFQVLAAHLTARKRRKVLFMALSGGAALSYVAFALIALVAISDESRVALIIAFGICAFCFMTMIQLSLPIMFTLMTDNTPMKKRGRLFGYRTVTLGVSTAIMGFVAGSLLRNVASPRSYEISFLLGGCFYLVATMSILLLRDHANPTVRNGKTIRPVTQLKNSLTEGWNNPNYRMLVFFHLLNMSAITLAPFVIPFGVNRLGIAPEQVSQLTIYYFAAMGIGGVVVGKVADTLGYKTVMMILSVCLLVFFVAAMNANSFLVIAAAYALSAIPTAGAHMVLTNFSVEILPKRDAGTLTAMGNLIILPIVAGVAPISGAMIDRGGTYAQVFLIGVVLSGVALIGIAALLREPRSGRVYVIKRLPRR